MYSPYLQFPSVCEIQYDADEFRIPYRLPSSTGGDRQSNVRTATAGAVGGGSCWLPRISRSGRLSVQFVDGEAFADSNGYGYGVGAGGRLAKSAPNFADDEGGWLPAGYAYGDAPEGDGVGEDDDGEGRRRQRIPDDAGRQTRIQFNLTQQQQQQQQQGERRRLQSLGGGRYSTSQLTYHSLYSYYGAASAMGFKSLNETTYLTEAGSADEAPPPEWIDDLRKWIEVREDTSYLTFVNRAQLGANPKSRQAGDEEDAEGEGGRRRHGHDDDEMCDRFLHHFNLAQVRRDDLVWSHWR